MQPENTQLGMKFAKIHQMWVFFFSSLVCLNACHVFLTPFHWWDDYIFCFLNIYHYRVTVFNIDLFISRRIDKSTTNRFASIFRSLYPAPKRHVSSLIESDSCSVVFPAQNCGRLGLPQVCINHLST